VPHLKTPTEKSRKRAAGVMLELFLAAVLLIHAVRGLGRAIRAPPAPVAPPPPLAVDLMHDPPGRLVLLPGVGKVRAAAIVEDRRARGPYTSFDDLARVHGIGKDTVRRIREAREVRPVLTVPEQ
jgi:competence protein ComEA